jgi:sterol desaturase/sphingolipid hydroxylase (fatty acid hydroxylase superfamily)
MDRVLAAAQARAATLFSHFCDIFLSLGSTFSAASLLSALVIAVGVLVWRGRRPLRPRVLLRALFPRRFFTGASSKADFGLFFLNGFFPVGALAWALLSAAKVSSVCAETLTDTFGPAPQLALAAAPRQVIATVILFLAYEFAYWLDHMLSHRVPVLWEFHKVHHTAETLSPLTNFRVHPVDSVVFANIAALIIGLSAGALQYAFGQVSPLTLSGANVITVAFLFLTSHLQHSHLWISFTGLAGRLFMSPAHHQVHHSSDPRHFNRNFGSGLAIWDWMFGTLYAPPARRERLTFGAETTPGVSPHSVTGTLITPFAQAAKTLGAPRRPGVVPTWAD